MAGQRQDALPITEASALLGLSAEALRKRLNRGTLDGYKQDGAWFVVLPTRDAPSGQAAGRQDGVSGRQDAPPPPSPHQVTPAEVERAIEATAARYVADFAGLYDRISTEVAERYEQTIAAKDETIAELRRRAEAAEVERDELRSQALPQPPSAAPSNPAQPDTPDAQQPAGGVRAWLRRVFAGE
jgi:hypothetical protein